MRFLRSFKYAIFFTLLVNSDNAMNCASDPIKSQDMSIVYKIMTPSEWQAFQQSKTFAGSKMDLESGFIHAAFAEQKVGVLDKFYKDTNQVVVVEIDTSKLTQGTLKIETNKEGGDQFPHIYGIIPLAAVKSSKVMLN